MNTTSITARIASFATAAALTLAMFVGVNALAVSDAPADLIAKVAAAPRA